MVSDKENQNLVNDIGNFLSNYQQLQKKIYPYNSFFSTLGLNISASSMFQDDVEPLFKIYLDSDSPVNTDFLNKALLITNYLRIYTNLEHVVNKYLVDQKELVGFMDSLSDLLEGFIFGYRWFENIILSDGIKNEDELIDCRQIIEDLDGLRYELNLVNDQVKDYLKNKTREEIDKVLSFEYSSKHITNDEISVDLLESLKDRGAIISIILLSIDQIQLAFE